MDESFARLSESGFDGYASAREEATAGIGQADDANGDAFDGLEESVSDMRGRLEESSSETRESMQEAASETQATSTELDGAFETVTSEWRESIDEQLREGCEEAGEALASAYSSWGEEAGSVADALGDQIEEVLDGAAEFVGSDSTANLTAAREGGLDDPGGELIERFDETKQTLETGESLADALGDLVPEVQKCLNVVDEVERLLNAMG
jgi:DNA anti-recombination protein RmuC